MKKFLPIIILLIAFESGAFALSANIDDKAICEKTKGNWQIFNNDCANLCDNKFEFLPCTQTAIFSCNCGNNRCWDNDKCISEKVAKINWLEKTKAAREQRQAEIEEMKIKAALRLQQAQNNPQNNSQPGQNLTNNNIASTTPILNPLTPATPTPAVAAPAEAVLAPITDPEILRKNAEQKAICEKQNGTWKEFRNGCADNCGSKVAKIAMCTMSLTFGCQCGGSKCWDNSKNICVEIEEYKTLLNNPKPLETKAPQSLPTDLPNSEVQPPLPTLTR
ncbi:MAG: hypothetical protein V4612_01460 [Pseudomonadota bacterium]